MGFKKRFIDDNSILKAAEGDFIRFNKYMLNADAFIIEGSYAPWFWNIYSENENSRGDIWEILNSDFSNKHFLMDELANLKRIVKSPDRDVIFESSIKQIYEKCTDCPKDKIQNIIYIIKNQNGKATV